MKQTVQVRGIVEKQKKDGSKYWGVQTEIGEMNTFDTALIEVLYQSMGKRIEVESVQVGKWNNLRDIYVNGQSIKQPQKKEWNPARAGMTAEDKKEKLTGIYTRYAVDIYIGTWNLNSDPEKYMAHCVRLVKLAKELIEGVETHEEEPVFEDVKDSRN